MSIGKQIAEGVAEGITAFLDDRSKEASHQIETLGRLHDDLHQKSGELAQHQATRPSVERVALEAVMTMTNPAQDKTYTKTDAEKNLDLHPKFAAWRQTRNNLEGEVHFLQNQIDVQRRLCDLSIALLQIVAREG